MMLTFSLATAEEASEIVRKDAASCGKLAFLLIAGVSAPRDASTDTLGIFQPNIHVYKRLRITVQ